jgi:phosphoribosylglycinamide formyltransferase-1
MGIVRTSSVKSAADSALRCSFKGRGIVATDRPPVRLGILISGAGTNLQAIIDEIERGALLAEIRIVVSNRADAAGLDRARNHRIEAQVIDHRKFPSREEFDRAILALFRARGVELVVCAGFMRLFSHAMLDAFPDKILNTHNALLPSFPGIHGPADALNYGVKITGCSVFFVTQGVDTGPIIIQSAIPVMPSDDVESLSARIRDQEHRILPHAIRLYQQGRLEIDGRVVKVRDYPGNPAQAMVNPPIEKG